MEFQGTAQWTCTTSSDGRAFKSQQVLSNAEIRGEIPAPALPEVKKFANGQPNNFLKSVNALDLSQAGRCRQVISIFTQKGGTLKTTLSHAFARILALHGIRVVVVGLDIKVLLPRQCSAPPTWTRWPTFAYNKAIKGLYHFLQPARKSRRIEEIIQN